MVLSPMLNLLGNVLKYEQKKRRSAIFDGKQIIELQLNAVDASRCKSRCLYVITDSGDQLPSSVSDLISIDFNTQIIDTYSARDIISSTAKYAKLEGLTWRVRAVDINSFNKAEDDEKKIKLLLGSDWRIIVDYVDVHGVYYTYMEIAPKLAPTVHSTIGQSDYRQSIASLIQQLKDYNRDNLLDRTYDSVKLIYNRRDILEYEMDDFLLHEANEIVRDFSSRI